MATRTIDHLLIGGGIASATLRGRAAGARSRLALELALELAHQFGPRVLTRT